MRRTAAVAHRLNRSSLVLTQARRPSSSESKLADDEELLVGLRELACRVATFGATVGLIGTGAWWAVGSDMARVGHPKHVLLKAKVAFDEGKAGHEALSEVTCCSCNVM
jgi:hypothetical protein